MAGALIVMKYRTPFILAALLALSVTGYANRAGPYFPKACSQRPTSMAIAG